MERFYFSKGHIFIRPAEGKTDWSIFVNSGGFCGRAESKDQAVENIINHWKFTGKLKAEIKLLFENKKPALIVKTAEQLELF